MRSPSLTLPQLKIDAYGETTFAGRREKQSQMGRGHLAEMRLTSRQVTSLNIFINYQLSIVNYELSIINSQLNKNHKMGIRSAGSMLSVLQSFNRRSERPEAVMSKPPTMSSSAIIDSLTASLDRRATR